MKKQKGPDLENSDVRINNFVTSATIYITKAELILVQELIHKSCSRPDT